MEAGLLAAADRANLTSSIKPSTTPVLSSGSEKQNAAVTPPASVEVTLSDAGRQLSIESQQRNSIQAAPENQSADSRLVKSEEQANTQPSSVGEQSTVLSPTETTEQRLSSTAPPISDNITSNTENVVRPQEQSAEVRPHEENHVAVEPVKSNQNASVVTQYNVAPDSIIGRSISIQA
mgnify:CR=1 FL=1